MSNIVPYQDLKEMANAMGKLGLFGKSPDQLLPLMLIAQAEGKHPAIAAQEYDIIQGRPALKAQSALSRFQAAGGSIKWIDRSDSKCSAVFTHSQGGTVTIEWSIERAAKMGLSSKDNWKKQPMIMLQWRTVAEGVRVCFPACLSGLYIVEEVRDFEPSKFQPTPEQKPIFVQAAPPVLSVEDEAIIREAADIVIDIEALGDCALMFLRKIKWVSENGSFLELTNEHLKKIASGWPAFEAKCKEFL